MCTSFPSLGSLRLTKDRQHSCTYDSLPVTQTHQPAIGFTVFWMHLKTEVTEHWNLSCVWHKASIKIQTRREIKQCCISQRQIPKAQLWRYQTFIKPKFWTPFLIHIADNKIKLLTKIKYDNDNVLAWRAFSVAGPTVYNSLPANIRLCQKINSFKHHLKTHLL